MATHYRDTRAGSTLVDALDELVTDGRLPGDLAVKVLEEVRRKRGRRSRHTHLLALQPSPSFFSVLLFSLHRPPYFPVSLTPSSSTP
jgi:hypothetical protein